MAARRSARLEEANGISVADPTADRRSWRRVSDGMGVNGSRLVQAKTSDRATGVWFTLEEQVVHGIFICSMALNLASGAAMGKRPRHRPSPTLCRA